MEAPEIDLGNQLYWTAFWDLCSCRSVEVPIAWRDTQLWAESYSLGPHEREMLHAVVRGLDKVFLDFVNQRREAERAKQAAEADKNKDKPVARRGR